MTLQEALIADRMLRQVRREESGCTSDGSCEELEGLYRHASTHAAGVVIGAGR